MILALHYIPTVDQRRFAYLGAHLRSPSGIELGFSCFVKHDGATVPKDAGFSQVECGRFGVTERDVIARLMNHNKTASTIAIHGAQRFRDILRACLDEMGRPDDFPRPLQSVIDTAELSRIACKLPGGDETADAYRIPTLAEATAALLGTADPTPRGVGALAAHLTKIGMTEAA